MAVSLRQGLELVALQLAGVVAAIHLWWGLERFVNRYLIYGYVSDPRPLVFVVTTTGIIAGVAYVAMGGERKPVYLAGIGLFVAYLSGYFWWHLTGHGGALPGLDGHSHYHGDTVVLDMIAQHAREYPIVMASKAAEAIGIVVLSVLFWLEHIDPRQPANAATSRTAGNNDPADD
jgi:hypothetical protein